MFSPLQGSPPEQGITLNFFCTALSLFGQDAQTSLLAREGAKFFFYFALGSGIPIMVLADSLLLIIMSRS